MDLFKRLLPFGYSIVFVILPMYAFKLTYFQTILAMFYIPSVILYIVNNKWMKENNWIKPFWWANLIGGIVCFYFEYVALGMGVWHFSGPENYLPFWLWGAPPEEFLFYFGATPLCILLYTYFYRFSYIEELQSLPIVSAWGVAVAAPFILIALKIFQLLWKWMVVSVKDMLLTVFAFFITMTIVEHFSVMNKYWIYDYTRLWGPKIWEIPIEEYLIYYILGPVFVILLNHIMQCGPTFELRGLPKSILKQKIHSSI